MFYEEVFRKLNERAVKYAVTGGLALVLHGVVRLTADLDLFVELSGENLEKFWGAMEELGFMPRVPITKEILLNPAERDRLFREKNMVVMSFYHPADLIKQVDFFIKEPVPFGELEIEWKKAKDIEIPVVSKNTLIRLKRMARRPQDLKDIEMLEKL